MIHSICLSINQSLALPADLWGSPNNFFFLFFCFLPKFHPSYYYRASLLIFSIRSTHIDDATWLRPDDDFFHISIFFTAVISQVYSRIS